MTESFLRALRHQQLFFARMHRDVYRVPGRQRLGKKGTRGRDLSPIPDPPRDTVPSWVQLRMDFHTGHDFSRFDRRRHADLSNPTLIQARQAGRVLAASRGWGRWVAQDVDRALVVLLSNHTGDDKIRYTELAPALRHHGLTIERTIDVFTDLDLFHDDKTPTFGLWLDRKLEPLAPAIRHDVQAWLRLLHDGGPRTRARNPETPLCQACVGQG